MTTSSARASADQRSLELQPATPALVQEIIRRYQLPLYGRHGIGHWARVFVTGRRLALQTVANETVIELFALFHDSCRENESISKNHGLRGAELAAKLRGDLFDLPDTEFNLLYEACAKHTDGLTEADVTIQTCWDADRLDLARVGISPDRFRLCTEGARDPAILRWAHERSLDPTASLPSWLRRRWGISQ